VRPHRSSPLGAVNPHALSPPPSTLPVGSPTRYQRVHRWMAPYQSQSHPRKKSRPQNNLPPTTTYWSDTPTGSPSNVLNVQPGIYYGLQTALFVAAATPVALLLCSPFETNLCICKPLLSLNARSVSGSTDYSLPRLQTAYMLITQPTPIHLQTLSIMC